MQHFSTAMVITALVAAIVLVMKRDDRIFSIVGLFAAGIEALMAFNIISLSSGKFRIDVIVPAVLALAMGVCWSKSSVKSTITAATAGFLVGLIQVLFAVHVLD